MITMLLLDDKMKIKFTDRIKYHQISAKMLSICHDMIRKIGELLSDKEKMALTMTSIDMDQLKYVFIYYEKINICKIDKLPYFDNFERVKIFDTKSRCPKNAKRIYFLAHTTNIPPFVTHLTFVDDFNSSIKDCIPSSVTYLAFGHYFNQPIENSIPSTITHLTLGNQFNQSLENNIPTGVTHLIYGPAFSHPTANDIPHSVTHLTINLIYHQIKNFIPSSVTYLTLIFYYWGQKLDPNIVPSSVTHLTLDNFDQRVDNIPQWVTHLKFGSSFDYPLIGLPKSIIEIQLRPNYSRSIDLEISSRIKIIRK